MMPVHGHGKVDSKCLSMCARVEPFTRLLGTRGKELKVPAGFWQELATDCDAVSNFIVCLVARLISLDSAHGLDPLVSVYRDLVELPVDQAKYRAWASKALSASMHHAALELQHAIVSTIYFLTEYHSYRPTIHLRHIYLRWNLARNYCGDGPGKLADAFEEKVISPFSMAQSKEVTVHSPQQSQGEGEVDGKMVSRLIDQCCQNHRRANFGIAPPHPSKLCLNSTVCEALSYVGLQEMLTRSLPNSVPAVHHVLSTLGQVAMHGQSTEQGDREDLLPLLQLLKDFVTMLFPVNRADAYHVVMPFYMWPVAHAECSRRLLSLLVQEGKVRGTTFRRNLLVENNLRLKLRKTEIRGQFVHMLVDVSDHRNHGNQFSDLFMNRQDMQNTESLHRMIIRNCFKCVFPSRDLVELETQLLRLSSKSLASVCCECVEVMEGGVTREDGESGDVIQEELVTELNKIHQKIIQETEDEQRDSAVSCSGVDSTQPMTEEALGIFLLPSPSIPTHPLKHCKYPTILTKLREILVQCQKQLSPAVSQRTFSQTSMDSTGSSHMESEVARPLAAGEGHSEGTRHPMGEGPIRRVGRGRVELVENNLEISDAETTQSNGHEEVGKEEEERCDGHAASPDSGHVMSPDPVAPSTPTEVATPNFHAQELNGDGGSPNSSDEVFEVSSSQESSDTQVTSSPNNITRTRSSTVKLIRRKTVPAKLNRPVNAINRSSSSSFSRTSVISHAPSYGTSRKGYTNVAGTPQIPMAALPVGSRILSSRRGSMSLPQKKRVPLVGVGSPFHTTLAKDRVLKIVLSGNDLLVCHAAKAYAYLLSEEPNLFVGLDIRFYHVPLSTASSADQQVFERTQNGTGDGTDTILGEQPNTGGLDVNIGRYMSHLDSWYERNVALAVHHSLRLLPPCQKMFNDATSSFESHISSRSPLTPRKILVDSVAHYLREANHCIKAKMYKLKMILRPESSKSHKMDHREMYILHRLDIQRLTGKRNNRQAKPFEANLQLTELSLDGSFVRTELTPAKDVWSVRASNIPQAFDSTVANPESECFELSVVTGHSEGSMFTKSRLTEEAHYHTYDLTLETKKEHSLTVVVDGDCDMPIDNVIRLEIIPAHMNTGLPALSRTVNSTFSPMGVKGDCRTEKQLFLPLMTFWPVDL